MTVGQVEGHQRQRQGGKEELGSWEPAEAELAGGHWWERISEDWAWVGAGLPVKGQQLAKPLPWTMPSSQHPQQPRRCHLLSSCLTQLFICSHTAW